MQMNTLQLMIKEINQLCNINLNSIKRELESIMKDWSIVMRMVEYVRGSKIDTWHWCKNCTQYPMYIYQKTSVKPPSDFCEQCKTLEDNNNCKM
jgi:hypothetical protein